MEMKAIAARFERFLRTRGLRLTRQRMEILRAIYATHKHVTAEQLFDALQKSGKGDSLKISRATVYRTLSLLVEGGFLETLDTNQGELLYEHVLGHRHHDHIVCVDCGRIEEFTDERIEAFQREAALRKGFTLQYHNLRLFGTCASCTRKRERRPAGKASG